MYPSRHSVMVVFIAGNKNPDVYMDNCEINKQSAKLSEIQIFLMEGEITGLSFQNSIDRASAVFI